MRGGNVVKQVHPVTTRPSRRDLMTGRFDRASLHVASLLVQAWPERIAGLIPVLNGIAGVEVHDNDERGRVIVTVEAANDAGLIGAITNIERTDGVINASLVYHQVDLVAA